MKLKPCPFCGNIPNKPLQFGWDGHVWWEIHCNPGFKDDGLCNAYQGGKTKDQVVDKWNTRTPED